MSKRVIGYARLSAASEESTSIARQREIITQTVAARGWHLVDIVEDPEASASRLRLNRPGLIRVRQALDRGEADAVMVWRLDRIARSVVDFGTLLDEGVEIVSATEPLDTTTPMGKAMSQVLQVFAELEARTIAARVSSSVDYLRRNGRWPGGPTPYGYRSVSHPEGIGRALEVDPEKARYVREATDRLLAGESVMSIARDFTSRQVPPSRNARGWTAESIRRILTGDAILGRVRTRGELVRGEDGLPLVVWPTIITVEESQRIRARFAANRVPETRRRSHSRLLSGLIVCGTCGEPMQVHHPRPRSTTDLPVYACRSRNRGITCTRPTSVACARAEEEITERFLAVVGGMDVVEEIVLAPEPVGLAEVEEALGATAQELTRTGADVPALIERLTLLRTRREEILALPTLPTSSLIETGRTFREEWEARADDVASQRSLLSSAVEAVEVAPAERRRWTPERLTIRWSR